MALYKPIGLKEWLLCLSARAALRLFALLGCRPPETDRIDASSMLTRANCVHRFIFPRFFEKIHVEEENIERVREAAHTGTVVYVTKWIGQLEYNFFSYLFLDKHLPLARFANQLSLLHWMPLKTSKAALLARLDRFVKSGPMPHPVRSGYLTELVKAGSSVLIRLRSTELFDDLFWEAPEDDPISAIAKLLDTQPIWFVPLYFLWDKRPSHKRPGIIDLIFGEREEPGRIRKIVLFWRNYKKRAVVKIGEPIPLSHFAHSGEPALTIRSTLLNVLKQEKMAITGPPLKPRRFLIEQTLEDKQVEKELCEISLERGKSIDDLRALAKRYAGEIAADINYNYIEFGARAVAFIIKGMYDGVVVDQRGLNVLKRAASKTPFVLVPNHRSHMDYLLLSYLLYANNIAIPHVAAGMNLSFWPLGSFFRRCGAFFLRRTFGGNRLYRAVFTSYLHTLLREGHCLEFFIEGGRTRTGKLQRPKKGMLAMLLEAFLLGKVPDVVFVPVAITYDRVIEEAGYLDELKGGTKARERFRDLLKLGRHKGRYGRIYVNFGEPISVAALAQNQGVENLVDRVASSIMYAINREAVVTPSALVSLGALTTPNRGITEAQLMENINEFRRYLGWREVKFSEGLVRAIPKAISEFAGALDIHREFEPALYSINEERRMGLGFYRNSIVHFLVSLSSLANILLAGFKKGVIEISFEEIKGEYLFLKALFQYEFTFSTRLSPEEHIRRALEWLSSASVLAYQSTSVRVLPDGLKKLELYASVIASFFESYLVSVMASRDIKEMEERLLIRRMIKYGRHLNLLGRVRYPEAISKINFQNAMLMMLKEGVLVEGSEGRHKIYSWNAERGDKLQVQLERFC